MCNHVVYAASAAAVCLLVFHYFIHYNVNSVCVYVCHIVSDCRLTVSVHVYFIPHRVGNTEWWSKKKTIKKVTTLFVWNASGRKKKFIHKNSLHSIFVWLFRRCFRATSTAVTVFVTSSAAVFFFPFVFFHIFFHDSLQVFNVHLFNIMLYPLLYFYIFIWLLLFMASGFLSFFHLWITFSIKFWGKIKLKKKMEFIRLQAGRQSWSLVIINLYTPLLTSFCFDASTKKHPLNYMLQCTIYMYITNDAL